MKSHVSVLIAGECPEVFSNLTRVLETHQLDEDDIESIRSHHWDYWRFPTGDRLDDPEIREAFPKEIEEIHGHASYVRNLPDEYGTSAIITESEGWIDLQDFGWRMIDEPCQANDEAAARRRIRMREILSAHPDMICVQVITHC